MSYPISETLLREVAQATFLAWCETEAVIQSLPKQRRLLVEFGLSDLTFGEWEMALGRRHPADPRPLHGGQGCIA